MSLRDRILGAADAQIKQVTIPAWGDLHIRKFTIAGRNRVYKAWKDSPEMVPVTILMCSVCDEDGKLVFTDKDLPRLLDLDGETVDALVEEVKEFNGLNAKDDTEAEAKN